MKFTLLLLPLLLISCDQRSQGELSSESKEYYRFVHYNIKELDSHKLDTGHYQAVAAAEVIESLEPDFLSINEIQYDIQGVPTPEYKTHSQNVTKLLGLSNLSGVWDVNFASANTGMRSKKDENGHYSASRQNMEFADTVNYGLFPGQYSTGFASSLPIEARININKLTWLDWDPDVDLSQYDIGTAAVEEYELFDKNFNVSSLQIGEKTVKIITLHAVPAFNFGNDLSPNLERNKAQLEFLSWYLSGDCDKNSLSTVKACKTKIQPLSKGERFIAVGDLNVDLASEKPGAAVLKSLLGNPLVHDQVSRISPDNLRYAPNLPDKATYFRSGVDFNNQAMQLDYFIVSSNIKIHRIDTILPLEHIEELPCFDEVESASDVVAKRSMEGDGFVYEVFKRDNPREYCGLGMNQEYSVIRKASDHLPLVLEFSL